MKIAIMGAGGVGGLYGGRIAKAGEDVTLITRGAHLKALQQNGLRVNSAIHGDFELSTVKATDNPASVGPVDLVLMSVKTYDLDEASRAVAPMVGEDTVVIPLLNGMDIAERVGAVVGMDHVLGGTVYATANIVEPGVVRHVAGDGLIFGELEGGISARGGSIHRMFVAAGIQAELSPDVRKDIWSKFVGIAAIFGVYSVVRVPGSAVAADPDTRALLVDSMREVVALAHKQGIDLGESVVDKFLSILDNVPPDWKPSMLVDLEQGRKLEVEAVQGTVTRLGEELGVPTPVNGFLYAALKLHADGASPS